MWWSQDDDFVESFDASGEASFREAGPTLHHFRSSNLKNEEEEYLMECWQECLSQERNHYPSTPNSDKDGTVHRIYTDYLFAPLHEFPAKTRKSTARLSHQQVTFFKTYAVTKKEWASGSLMKKRK